MSKKPVVKIGRIIIHTPAELEAQHAKAAKSFYARNKQANGVTKRAAKNYDPRGDVCAHAVRAGAEDSLALPSRIGNRLHYRDGRVIDITAGNPV